MAGHKPNIETHGRRSHTDADALVVGSWLVVFGLALLLLRPSAPAGSAPQQAPALEIVSVQDTPAIPETPPEAIVAVNKPDFYPWIRPEPTGPLPEGTQAWSAPRKPRTGGFLTRLSAPLGDAVFVPSTYSTENTTYGGAWKAENIEARSGGAFIEVRREQSDGMPYTSGEMQTSGHYHFGLYETVMQPARGSGLVTAFFTYTGRQFGHPHDEIDIEFLGSDTTKVHFNYWRKGQTNQPATIDLPFDAADRPRLYAFDWQPDGITWYVEGVPLYSTREGDPWIPQAPGKVLFSAWTGKPLMEAWHGPPTFKTGSGTQFSCISYTPMGHDTPKCSDSYTSSSAASSTGSAR